MWSHTKKETRKRKHNHKQARKEKSIQTRPGNHWQYSILQTRHSKASFSHMHTLSLLRSSCFWLTFPCSPTAKQPQDRDKQKNTQTNDKFTTSQTSVYRSGRGQRIKRKTVREVRRVSFQVLQGHLVAAQYRHVLPTDSVFPHVRVTGPSAMAALSLFLHTCDKRSSCTVPFGSHLFLESAVHLQDWEAKIWKYCDECFCVFKVQRINQIWSLKLQSEALTLWRYLGGSV